MNELKGNVVTLMTLAGDVIGELIDEKKDTVTLAHPRLFIQTENGPLLASTVSGTAKEYPEEATVSRSSFVCMTEAADRIKSIWASSRPEEMSKGDFALKGLKGPEFDPTQGAIKAN